MTSSKAEMAFQNEAAKLNDDYKELLVPDEGSAHLL